jgi:hypothetical protein
MTLDVGSNSIPNDTKIMVNTKRKIELFIILADSVYIGMIYLSKSTITRKLKLTFIYIISNLTLSYNQTNIWIIK